MPEHGSLAHPELSSDHQNGSTAPVSVSNDTVMRPAKRHCARESYDPAEAPITPEQSLNGGHTLHNSEHAAAVRSPEQAIVTGVKALRVNSTQSSPKSGIMPSSAQ